MQPMNYTIQTGDAGDAFTQGMNRTAGMMATVADYQKSQAIATAAQQKAEADAYKRQRFMQVAQNPTPDLVNKLSLEFPEIQEAAAKSIEYMSSTERRNTHAVASSVLSAIDSDNQDAAIYILDQQAKAAENSKNQEAYQKYQTLKDAVIANPTGAKFGLMTLLRGTMDPKDWASYSSTLGKEARDEALQPALVEKGKAEASKAVFDVRKTSAEAVIKEVEAKFAPQVLLSDLGLRKAQTNAANASAASSYASASASKATAARANAEAKQITSGVIPSDKRPEAESKFRDEYSKRTAGYQEVKQSYGRVLSSNNDAAGDISMIFGYMKMLDPGSVVREGEFATAQNAAGIDTRLQNVYNKALKGERLTDGQRKMFKGQAESLYKTAAKQEDEIRSGIGRIASGYGLNTKNIFYTDKESVPGGSASPVGSTLPGGFKVLGVER